MSPAYRTSKPRPVIRYHVIAEYRHRGADGHPRVRVAPRHGDLSRVGLEMHFKENRDKPF
jgi:hypothetical protein